MLNMVRPERNIYFTKGEREKTALDMTHKRNLSFSDEPQTLKAEAHLSTKMPTPNYSVLPDSPAGRCSQSSV